MSCGGNQQNRTDTKKDTLKVQKDTVAKTSDKPFIEKEGLWVQNIWESYNYYHNGLTEFIIEEYSTSKPAEKSFWYYTSKNVHQYDIPNPVFKQLLDKGVVKNEYSVAFEGSSKIYKLVFSNGKMDCIDNGNIQSYAPLEKTRKENFTGIFRSFKVYSCAGEVVFEDTRTNKLLTFPLGTFSCNCDLQDRSVNGCDYTSANPHEAANKSYKNKSFQIQIERGFISDDSGIIGIGDNAIITLK